jgi:hypothetical protein
MSSPRLLILGQVLVLILFCAVTAGWAQSLSTLRGTVTDASGAVVPGVEITVKDQITGLKARTVLTDQQGNYEIPDIKRGQYRLIAQLPGFRKSQVDDIILASDQNRRVDIVLEVGAAETEIIVSGAAAAINTEDAKIGAEFTGNLYKYVPIAGNSWSSALPVLATMPNVQFYAGCVGCITMAGQTTNQNGMDGVKEENIQGQTANMENVAEVKTVAVNNSAEFSRTSYYDMVTKRGGKDFHSELSYYHRNSALGARGFFEDQKPKKLYHTINASVSGPIIKEKTFFYFLWNGERVPEKTFHLTSVAANPMRGGDFSQLLRLDSPVQIVDPLNGQPFAGNIIPSGRISDLSLKTQENYFPEPNRGGPDDLVNNYEFIHPYPDDQFTADVYVTRLDHNLSSKNSIYGRFSTYFPEYVVPGELPTEFWTAVRHSYSWAIVDTHVFSPQVVNTFTFGGNRDYMGFGMTIDNRTPVKGDEVVSRIGLQGVNPQGHSTMGSPIMYINGVASLYVSPGSSGWIDQNFSYADSVNWSKGRHVLKSGFEHRIFTNFDGAIPEGTYGQFYFDGRFTGYPYADFLLGLPGESYRLDPLTDRKKKACEFGIYVTDTIKVTSRLNLDLGLRWDLFGSPSFEDHLQYNWDPASGDVIIPPESLSKVSPLYPENITAGQVVPSPYKKNFLPRIGVAYRLTGNTVLRGGYGIFAIPTGWTPYELAQGGGPFQIGDSYTNSITNGVPLFSFPNPFPAGGEEIPSQSVSGYPENSRSGYAQQYNLTLEHQIGSYGLRFSYIGSHNSRLNYSIEINKPQPSLIPFTDDRRPYPQFAGASLFRTNGEAKYDAFTFEVQKKVGRLLLDSHWTWARNYNNTLNTGPGSKTLNTENPYAPLRWNQDWDPRHRVVLNVAWDLPVGSNGKYLNKIPGALDQVIGNWKVYWVAFLQTGQFFSPSFSGSDPSNTNTYGGLPDRLSNGNLASGSRTLDRWFDTSAFVEPPQGRFGNCGVNVLEGPGMQNHNLSIAKVFRITERVSFNFTTMISNLFNHPNFYDPGNDISVPGVAGVIGAGWGQHSFYSAEKSGARMVEFRVRLEY